MRKWYFFVFIFIVSAQLQAKHLTIGLSFGPPWAYYNDNNEVIGIHPDFFKAALAHTDHTLTFEIYGYSRLMSQIKNSQISIAAPMVYSIPGVIMSEKYIPLDLVAISLKKSNLKIGSINDLVNMRVITFQKAKETLGTEFKLIAEALGDKYTEFADRERQADMLIRKRTDVIIGDGRVLKFLVSKLYPHTAVTVHQLRPYRYFSTGSKDAELIKEIEYGYGLLREKGLFEQILETERPFYSNKVK